MSTKTDLSDYKSFGVTAIYKEEDTYQLLFANAEATKSAVDGFWGIEDKDKAQWPIDGIVSFHAYAPYNTKSSNMLTVTAEPEKVQSKITYTASADDIINQPDLIVATSTGSRNNPGQDDAVNLQFSHALTAVSFAISKDLVEVIGAGNQLVSISLEGVYTQGDCELAAKDAEHSDALLKWTGTSDKTGKYEFDLTDKNIIIDENLKDMALTEDNQTLMMIPQTLTADAKLKFEFLLNGVPQSVIIDMQGHEWLPGTSVIYKLSASAINSLTNAEVVYPTTWNEAGYPKKAFAENEAIGLYAVSKDNKIVASNVKLVKQKNEKGEEVWKTTENKRFLYTANYRYFAYYPYDSTLKDEDMNAEATDADGFFAKKITGWNPVADQKTEAVLLRQDLQVAEGVIDNDASTLTFNMAHSMGLAVLNLKSKEVPVRRTFKTNNFTYYYPKLEGRVTTEPAASEYTDATAKQSVEASTEFNGNIPFMAQTTDKRYVQIVKPNVPATFKAEDETDKPRTAWGILKSYSFNVDKNQVVAKDITSDADFYYLARLFSYKGSTESFTVPVDGTYTLECWGAGPTQGGKSEGNYQAQKNQILYICVGGKGKDGSKSVVGVGGYNGGGNGGWSPGYTHGGGGSGATHICLQDGLLKELETAYDNNQLLMVAGGQGGDIGSAAGPYGGGIEGGKPTSWSGAVHAAATQSSGYAFGTGQNGRNGTRYTNGGGEGSGGSGGGLYGGYAPQHTGTNSNSSGGGGSGYVNAILVDGKTIAGNQSFLSPSGVSETGHAGNGAALITWLP